MTAVSVRPFEAQLSYNSSESPTVTQVETTDSSMTSTSVLKALQLLDAFRGVSDLVGVSEIARLSGIHKSTAFRLLATLEHGEFVERVGTKYRLTLRVFELGNRVGVCAPKGLREVALPHLTDLYASTGRAVHMGLLAEGDVVYLEKIHGSKTALLPSAVGGRLPANCSALGKILMAFSSKETVEQILSAPLNRLTSYSIVEPARLIRQLHQAQEEGFSSDLEESAQGLACVAAPIIVAGKLVAAISVSGPTHGFHARNLSLTLRKTAQQISLAMSTID